MQYNSVEEAVTHLERQVFNLNKTCDKQATKSEHLEDALYGLLMILNETNKSEHMDELIKTYIHNCNLFSKKDKLNF